MLEDHFSPVNIELMNVAWRYPVAVFSSLGIIYTLKGLYEFIKLDKLCRDGLITPEQNYEMLSNGIYTRYTFALSKKLATAVENILTSPKLQKLL